MDDISSDWDPVRKKKGKKQEKEKKKKTTYGNSVLYLQLGSIEIYRMLKWNHLKEKSREVSGRFIAWWGFISLVTRNHPRNHF